MGVGRLGRLCTESKVKLLNPIWEHSKPKAGIPLEGNLVFVQKTEGQLGLFHFSKKERTNRCSHLLN